MNKVKFGDVVKEIKINVDRANNPYEYFIAGEHMESGNIHIKKRGRFENSDVGPAFVRIFKPGQVLYGSRRTYLKKVAVADIEGITSNTTFVLETNDENVLLQSLLPFIMLTESFTEFSVKNSKGSTNPYILFSDLAHYEFKLPSIEEQKELSEILLAADKTIVAYNNLLEIVDELVKSQFIEMFGAPVTNPMDWKTKPFSYVAPESQYDGDFDETVWLLNLDMVESHSGRLIEKLHVPIESIGNSTCTFSSEHVLYSKLRPYLNKVVVPEGKGYATTEMIPMKPNLTMLDRSFLAHLLRSDEFVAYVTSLSAGTRMPRVPMTEFRNFKCILPPIEMQKQFAVFVEQTDKSKFALQQNIEKLEQLRNALMQKSFG